MIFVTVGTQLPFDRLVRILDDLAGKHGLEVFAQTADPAAHYKNIEHAPFLDPDRYDDVLSRSSLIVGHAGIGTILTAKRENKPVIIFPRKASLGEHRNEHQRATAEHLTGHRGVYVAQDLDEMERLLQAQGLDAASFSDSPEKDRLLAHLRDYVYGR